jgi:flagellar basal-body rod modification protein FlgD
MAINAIGENVATYGQYKEPEKQAEDKSILGKDDFMQLLLVELQHQDPTEPMDSEKILTQTSQLAALESAENTNKALEDLSKSLASTQEFSTIAAIGKRADLGSDAIQHDEGSTTSFELYFPEDVESGTIDITDLEDNLIAQIEVEEAKSAGVYQFDWDGRDAQGNFIESGIYRVNASYKNPDGDQLATRLGAYPIESVRFENGKSLVKLGSNYVPLEDVVEVY